MCHIVLLDLLDQLRNQNGRGDSFPSDNLTKMLEEAQRMVKEMENRNFTSQRTAAETERDKAKKRNKFSSILHQTLLNLSDSCSN